MAHHKRPRPRPTAERLIDAIRCNGRLTSTELQALVGVRHDNVTGRLGPEIARGVIATYLVPARDGHGSVRCFEWLGDTAMAGTSKRSMSGQPTSRPCLCCGRLFPSAGPHNRLCGSCRTRNTSPYAL